MDLKASALQRHCKGSEKTSHGVGKIFAKYISDKWFVPIIYKNSQNSVISETKQLNQNMS